MLTFFCFVFWSDQGSFLFLSSARETRGQTKDLRFFLDVVDDDDIVVRVVVMCSMGSGFLEGKCGRLEGQVA